MVTAAERLGNPIDNPPEFINGKTYKHYGGELVNFDDDSWCLVPTRGNRSIANFTGLSGWLMRPAKLTVAYKWLGQGVSPGHLKDTVTAFRRLDAWLPEFEGKSMADLATEHGALLQLRLQREIIRYGDTLEQQRLEIGRELNYRERKQTCRSLGLLGLRGAREFVKTFNFAATLLYEVDGTAVSIRVRNPRVSDEVNPGRVVGSADPAKVLSPRQIADLERALSTDLKRYEKASALVQREVRKLDLREFERKQPNPARDAELYFGVNGQREHTCSEIAALRGTKPSGGSNVPRIIESFLSKQLGPELAAEVIFLRGRLPDLRRKRALTEIAAKGERIKKILSRVDFSIRDRGVVCLEKYFGINGFAYHSLISLRKDLGLKSDHGVTHLFQKCLKSLVSESKAKRLLSVRGRLCYYLSRAIKAQAVRLQLGVARRISAVLELPVDLKIRVQDVEGWRVVEIQFVARKMWGDEGLSEWVPCVDKFGEIAEDAIRVTQRLTKDLREGAPDDLRGRLFIIPDRSFDLATSLSPKILEAYLYTNNKHSDKGLLRRYALDCLSEFEFHHLRHTQSTHMMEAGGRIQDVARYLGHATVNSSTAMAGTFYLAGGTEAMRHRASEALRKGAATGLIFDGVARLKIEAMGPEAKAIPVPPNQLSFQEARERILFADIVDDVPIDLGEAAKLIGQKVVFNVTRQGGCLLQESSGPCPTANPCAVGILPLGAEPAPGCGCKYLVILPDSATQLSTEIAVMDAQLAEMSGDEWAGWRSHIEGKREHWLSLLKAAESLNDPN